MIRVDPENPRAVQLAERLRGYLELDRLDDKLCLVVGGDGFMLESIRAQGPGFTFLGLNAGTLGFLLNDIDEVAKVGRAIHDGRYEVYDFPRLEVTIENGAAAPPPDFAVNDVYVERMTGKTANLRLTVNGVRVVDRMVTDGVVVATALGSTGYSFSAGGPACHPLVPAIHVTPICVHTPRLPSLTLPQAAVVEIETLEQDIRPVRAVCDGADLGPVMEIQTRTASEGVRIAFLEGHQFTRTLVRKLIRA
jgi:NAD+ kinase